MGERLERFQYLAEDRELTARAAVFQPAIEDLEARRIQAIAKMFAEKAETSQDGVDPARIFGEEGAAICAAFIERMSADGFPASKLLKNEPATNSTVGYFWQRLIGRPLIPYKFRGYKIGEVGGTKNTEAYLCEDGRLRAYTPFFEAATDRSRGERCLIHDIPLDPVTAKVRPVTPIIKRDDTVIYGLEEVLLTHIAEAIN
jgi:hypothetical protein